MYCLDLPDNSPYLNPESEECVKCKEKGKIKEQETTDTVEKTEDNLCDCCNPKPSKDTEEPKDSNLKPSTFTLPTDKSPEVEPEVEPLEPEKTLEKTPEELELERQLEYERKTKEWKKRKKEMLDQGWKEGNIPEDVENPDDWETRVKSNQDDIEVTFHRLKPIDPITPPVTLEPEKELTPSDFTLPTTPVEPTPPLPVPPVEEPKITKEELKIMVKNAIREIKKDLKNKR